MVGALNGFAQLSAGFCTQARAAVPAHVMERLHGAAAVAQDDQVVTPNRAQKIITGACNLGSPPDTHPALSENVFGLCCQDGVGCVVLAGQCI